MLTSTLGGLRNPASGPAAGQGQAHCISIGPELTPLSALAAGRGRRCKRLWELRFRTILVVCLVGVATGIGCAGTRPAEPARTNPAPGGGRETVVTGDWDDVYAAALVGVPQAEA